MAGYKRYSMSNGAVDAYRNGEMPMSKWSKAEIMNAIGDKADLCKKLTLSELRSLFLTESSWHHTSLMYNKTYFYSIDEDVVMDLTEEQVTNIIESREKTERKVVNKIVPTYIIAIVIYSEWEGTRKHPRKVYYNTVVKFMSTDKMIDVDNSNKRKSSLTIVFQIEQKTKFASKERLLKKYKLEESRNGAK